jgi:hypothetical protein
MKKDFLARNSHRVPLPPSNCGQQIQHTRKPLFLQADYAFLPAQPRFFRKKPDFPRYSKVPVEILP